VNLELRVERLGEEHIQPYVDLSRSEYGDSAAVSNPAHLRWKFLDNPQGPSVGIHLYESGCLVGRMVALDRTFQYRRKLYKGAHVVDFLVHPKVRGMIPLLKLVQGLKKLAGFDFYLIMAPNPAGAAVWDNFWKMQQCFDLNVLIAPLRPAAIAQSLGKLRTGPLRAAFDLSWRAVVRLLNGACNLGRPVQIDRSWPDSAELEALTRSSTDGERATGYRTPAYLDWRYRRSPVFQYKMLFLRQDGQLVGYLVTRRTAYEGLDCLFVVDAFGLPQLSPRAWMSGLGEPLAAAVADKAHMAMTMGNAALNPLASLKRLPFFSVPARLLPRKATVYAEWITAPAFDFNQQTMYIALGDSDVI
jgi:hypothetical protein